MRDVGDEVAAHGLGVLELGDVLRDHQLAVVAVGQDLHRDHAVLVFAHVAHHQRIVEALPRQVVDELGPADQVGDALAHVAPRIQAEVLLGHVVAPFDLVRVVQHQHAVGRGLDRLDKARVLLLDLQHLGAPALDQPVQPVIDLAPQAKCARDLAVDRRIQHLPQAIDLVQVIAKQPEQRSAGKRQRRHRAKGQVDTGGQHQQTDQDGRGTGPDDIHAQGSGSRPGLCKGPLGCDGVCHDFAAPCQQRGDRGRSGRRAP
ncbi:hypothetical protein D3C72_1350720 [compost metagenome]